MAELHHAIDRGQEGILLTVTGEIDMSNAREMRALLLQTLDGTERLTVDLQGVASMDSSGIAALMEALRRAEADGKSFRVAELSERVRLALRLLRIERLLTGR